MFFAEDDEIAGMVACVGLAIETGKLLVTTTAKSARQTPCWKMRKLSLFFVFKVFSPSAKEGSTIFGSDIISVKCESLYRET